MRFLLVLLIPVAAFAFWQHHERAENEERLGEVATAIAQRTVGVRCPGFWRRLVEVGSDAGRVHFDVAGRPSDEAELSARTCDRLDDLADAETKPGFACLVPDDRACDRKVVETARALSTLAHESYHLAGVRDEAAAECYGIQSVDFVARRFGVAAAEARAVAVWAARTSARSHPPEYQSMECRSGGALDLRPGTPLWP
jgi:hypothetical protein